MLLRTRLRLLMRILVMCAHMFFLNFVGPINIDNEVESDNAPENNVGGVFWYYSCKGDEHGFNAHKIPKDVLVSAGSRDACLSVLTRTRAVNRVDQPQNIAISSDTEDLQRFPATDSLEQNNFPLISFYFRNRCNTGYVWFLMHYSPHCPLRAYWEMMHAGWILSF